MSTRSRIGWTETTWNSTVGADRSVSRQEGVGLHRRHERPAEMC